MVVSTTSAKFGSAVFGYMIFCMGRSKRMVTQARLRKVKNMSVVHEFRSYLDEGYTE